MGLLPQDLVDFVHVQEAMLQKPLLRHFVAWHLLVETLVEKPCPISLGELKATSGGGGYF